jgi:diguanylate cyclase (GGDEF)-like protein
MNALGLQRKFVLALLAAAMVLLLVLAALWSVGSRSQLALVRNTTEMMRQQALTGLEQRGQLSVAFLVEPLTNQIYYYDLQGLRETALAALDQDDIEYVLIYDAEGRVLHDGSEALIRFGEMMDDELAAAVIASDNPLTQWHEQLVDISRPVFLGRQRIGGVRIGLSRTGSDAAIARLQDAMQSEVRSSFLHQLRMLLLAFLGLLATAAVLGALVGRGLVNPIRNLARAVKDLESGRYNEIQLDTARGDELGDLLRSFNQMARTIQSHDQAIRKLAYQDTLTGLPNRLMFRELLEETLADYSNAGRSLGLMFIDLDSFKRINDTLGHDCGDEVLAEVARRLRDCAGQSETTDNDDRTLVARLGGDEFVALISGGEIVERCRGLAENILESLKQPFAAGKHNVVLSASIGITRFPDDAHNAKMLLKCGDLAMYQAKLRGKNGYAFYSEKMTLAADRLLLLEQDLRQAIEDLQIRIAYQPIVDCESGRLIAAEALLRWKHAELGEVPPEQFVAVAEASSLIEELGARVVRIACRDAARWQAGLPGVGVAVNVSGRQLLKPGLDALVASALGESGLDPRLLSLELTESSLLHDQFLASDALDKLRASGVGLWLDGFGTGFSGLSHLRQVRVDGVKIDRSFIADLAEGSDDLALTSAIIAMAHSIGMRVIGEGVEREDQLGLLKSRGCDLAQGFLFGRAMPVDELIERFRPSSLSARG